MKSNASYQEIVLKDTSFFSRAFPVLSEEHATILRNEYLRFRAMGFLAWKAIVNARATSSTLAANI